MLENCPSLLAIPCTAALICCSSVQSDVIRPDPHEGTARYDHEALLSGAEAWILLGSGGLDLAPRPSASMFRSGKLRIVIADVNHRRSILFLPEAAGTECRILYRHPVCSPLPHIECQPLHIDTQIYDLSGDEYEDVRAYRLALGTPPCVRYEPNAPHYRSPQERDHVRIPGGVKDRRAIIENLHRRIILARDSKIAAYHGVFYADAGDEPGSPRGLTNRYIIKYPIPLTISVMPVDTLHR